MIHTNPTNDVGFNKIFLASKIQGSTYHESYRESCIVQLVPLGISNRHIMGVKPLSPLL